MKYNMLKINAVELLKLRGEYTLDFSDPLIRFNVMKEEQRPDNAAFYQLIQVTGGKKEDTDALRNYMVQIDFEGAKLDEKAKSLLDKGVSIRFIKDGPYERFVAYDKSDSMAKKKQIYFVREKELPELHKRLMLDISGIKAVNSKLYSYRGKYYSDSERIPPEKLRLSAETVIVIDDWMFLTAKKTVFTGRRKGYRDDGKGIEYEFGSRQTNGIGDKYPDEFNQFDGEGLISPEYADIICACLGRTANSFQVRLPFGKGMLHRVDWKNMLLEMAEKNEGDADPESFMIKDVYGIYRCVGKAEIILTKSMFKCVKWLKDYCEKENIDDPIGYYFDKVGEYRHALYIRGTDASFREKDLVEYNYQLLNPLALEDKEFNAVLDRHVELINSLKPEHIYEKAAKGKNLPKLQLIKGSYPWMEVLRENPGFIKDRYVKEKVEEVRTGLLRNIIEGKFVVRGERRYLSGDLYYLMVHICSLINDSNDGTGNDEGKTWFDTKELSKKAIPVRSVYIPGYSIRCKNVALFRNPHLSRKEECAAHMYRLNENSIISRYFGHLDKVVMLSYWSINAQALGGADFDGDFVEVVSDREIVNAVIRGIYEGKNDLRKRTEDVILIPGGGSASPEEIRQDGKADPETIIRTFDSRIGQISNAALRHGMNEYYGVAKEERDPCAECTILTGLEIDAAKTGERPYLDDLLKYTIPKRDYKTEMDQLLAFLRAHGTVVFKKINKNGADCYNVCLKKGSLKDDFTVEKCGPESPSVLKLLDRYYELECTDSKELGNFKATGNPGELFGNTETVYDEKNDGDIEGLIRDYNEIRQIAGRAFKEDAALKFENGGNRFYTLLKFTHDSLDDPFDDRSGKTVREVADDTVAAIKNVLKTRDKADACLSRITEACWTMTPSSQREGTLNKILDAGEGNGMATESACLLSEFRCHGYMRLENCIKYAKTQLPESPEIYDDYRDNRFYGLFITARNTNKNRTQWEKDLVDAARSRLAELVPGCTSEDLTNAVHPVLPYRKYRQCDADGEFFWNIFKGKEINANVGRDTGI